MIGTKKATLVFCVVHDANGTLQPTLPPASPPFVPLPPSQQIRGGQTMALLAARRGAPGGGDVE